MQAPLDPVTRMVFDHLRQCSLEMRTVTYGEVARTVGITFTPNVIPHLNRIRDEICRAHGLPWLPAIAVNTDTGLPGRRQNDDGYGIIPDGMVIPDDDFRAWWRAMILQVFATNWDAMNFQNPDNQ